MWKDYFIYTWNYLPLPAGISNASASNSVFIDNPLRIHSMSDFEGIKITYVSSDPRIYIKIKDGGTGRYFTQMPGIDLRTFAGQIVNLGAGGNALIFRNLSIPLYFIGGTPVDIQAADFSGSENVLRLSIHGNKIKPGLAPWESMKRNYYRDEYFSYSISFNLGPNQNSQHTIPIETDSDWYIHSVLLTRLGPALLQINSGGSETNWQDKAIHIDNFSGNYCGYNKLPTPKFIQANSILNVSIIDISGSDNVVNITFEGVKRYFHHGG